MERKRSCVADGSILFRHRDEKNGSTRRETVDPTRPRKTRQHLNSINMLTLRGTSLAVVSDPLIPLSAVPCFGDRGGRIPAFRSFVGANCLPCARIRSRTGRAQGEKPAQSRSSKSRYRGGHSDTGVYQEVVGLGGLIKGYGASCCSAFSSRLLEMAL